MKKLKFNSKNLRIVLLASLGLSVIAFIAVLLVGLSALSKKSQSMVNLKVQSQTAETQLANLESAKKQVEKYSYFKSVAQTVIPSDKDQAEDILEIDNIATESGIAIQSITFPTSNLGLTTSIPQDATSTTAAQAAISQAQPVTGISGLYSLQLTITPSTDKNLPPSQQITYAKMLDFLNRIESNRHTAQITQVDITPTQPGSTADSSFGFSLVINIFIKP